MLINHSYSEEIWNLLFAILSVQYIVNIHPCAAELTILLLLRLYSLATPTPAFHLQLSQSPFCFRGSIVLDSTISESMWDLSFCGCLIPLSIMFSNSMLLKVTEFLSLLRFNTSPLCISTTFSSPGHLSVDTYIGSLTWLLWIMLPWTWGAVQVSISSTSWFQPLE